MPGDQIRLLALDGGGIRGLSSLMILQQLMMTIDAESPPKPCEYFDMIGGTSTGGIIAIMLGRLQMTVDDCINAYTSLSDKVFEKSGHRVTINGQIRGRFDAAKLERTLKQVLVDRGFDEDALLKDSPDALCKVYGQVDFFGCCHANLLASSARRADSRSRTLSA
jgi:patatin-like phospholipase/acyl hydrolase